MIYKFIFVQIIFAILSLPYPSHAGKDRTSFQIEVMPKIGRLEIVKRGDAVSNLPILTDAHLSPNMKKIVEEANDVLRHENASALVLVNGKGIIYENYKYDMSPKTLLLGLSMTKSITSMAVGKALCSGRIKNINDNAEKYVPELAGSVYGATSIKNLLKMASGVWDEADKKKYEQSDSRLLAYRENKEIKKISGIPGGYKKYLFESDERNSIVPYLASFTSRTVKAGERHLSSGHDTDTLALVVSRSTGMSLAKYISREIWQKIGAGGDAKLMVDRDGDAFARLGFYARSHDWIRLGQYILKALEGQAGDKCFQDYMAKATSRLIDKSGGRRGGYGYQFHIGAPMDSKTIHLEGRGGKLLFMEPKTGAIVYMFGDGKNNKWVGKAGFYDLVDKFIKISPEKK